MKAEAVGSTAWPTNSELCFSCEAAVSTTHRQESVLASQGPSEMGVPRLPRGGGRAAAHPGVVSGQGWEGVGQTEGEATAVPRGSRATQRGQPQHANTRPWVLGSVGGKGTCESQPLRFLCEKFCGTFTPTSESLGLQGSNQSILKKSSPEYSLEGLMLKLKLQYFGHLM